MRVIMSLFTRKHNRRRLFLLHKWQVLMMTWIPLICWMAMMMMIELFWEPSSQDAALNVVLERAMPPPLYRKEQVWSELYLDTKSKVRRKSNKAGVKPRTFPENYPDLPHQSWMTEPLSSQPASTTEGRHKSEASPTCPPRSEWHSYSFPTCNSFHELDFHAGLLSGDSDDTSPAGQKELSIEYKFAGGTRESWLVESSTESVILKTLNWPIAYDEITFDHQRVDALAAERLTKSPHIVDVYGFCGTAAINEFANGGSFGKMVRRWGEATPVEPTQLLVYARDIAMGLADIHEIDGRGNVTSMVHHDFAAKNVLVVDGKLKISDFNDAKLLGWSHGKRCHGFKWDGLCGTRRERTHRRAPEECMGDKYRMLTDEKVEVYHLGSFFFYLLTNGGWPYLFEPTKDGSLYKFQASEAKQAILEGKLPSFPPNVDEKANPATKALAQAMRWAYTFDKKKRPSARAIAEFLDEKVNQIHGESEKG